MQAKTLKLAQGPGNYHLLRVAEAKGVEVAAVWAAGSGQGVRAAFSTPWCQVGVYFQWHEEVKGAWIFFPPIFYERERILLLSGSLSS